MKKSKLVCSSNLRVFERNDSRTFLYNSIFGNLVEVNPDLLILLNFFKTPRDVKELEGSFYIKNLESIITELTARQFLVEGEISRDKKYLEDKLNNYIEEAKTGKFISNLRLNLTEECNCRCVYCYEIKLDKKHPKRKGMMSLLVAQKAINEFLKMAHANNLPFVRIRFFGGEPLLNQAVLISSIKHAVQKGKKLGIKVGFIINTNGTILNDNILKVAKGLDVNFIVSLDGLKEVNNKKRMLASGLGTFELVDKTLDILTKSHIPTVVSTVITEDSQQEDIRVFIDYLVKKKIKYLGINFQRLYEKRNIKNLEKVVEVFIFAKNYGSQKKIKIGGSWEIPFLKLHHTSFAYCGGIGKELSVNTEGQIFPCTGQLHEKLGDVASMSQIPMSKQYLNLLKRATTKIGDCRGCEIEGMCNGGCAADAYHINGTIFSPDSSCTFTKAMVKKMLAQENIDELMTFK